MCQGALAHSDQRGPLPSRADLWEVARQGGWAMTSAAHALQDLTGAQEENADLQARLQRTDDEAAAVRAELREAHHLLKIAADRARRSCSAA